jgi:hypothetical protein
MIISTEELTLAGKVDVVVGPYEVIVVDDENCVRPEEMLLAPDITL